MTSFHFDIGSRAQRAGRLISRVRTELLRVLSEKKKAEGLTQQAIAKRLGVDRSQINRQLSGESNLTLRSLAEIAWAMNMEVSLQLQEPSCAYGRNDISGTSTIGHGPIKVVHLSRSNGSAELAEQNAQLKSKE
ncbi:helix-turn-helix domain-containing protein [Rhodopseudomonas telluris]|uniref:Helix-turn-helix domain-containing protein n=1 Tax=Rhodopseudomonas telluris TaxID=644215 RepID=A0ABV6ELS4_9BRAD